MKRSSVILGLMFMFTAIFAHEPVKPEQKNRASSQITGIVIDTETGEALAGVCLILSENGAKTYTDLEGNFKIKDITPGTYDIEINYISYKSVTLKKVTAESPRVKVKVRLESAGFETL